jgi:TonB family protein
MFRKTFASLIVGASVACAYSAVAATGEPAEFSPTSPWTVNYADDSCRIGREFGAGDDRLILYLERYAPEDSFFLLIGGEPLGHPTSDRKIRLTFGPGGFTRFDPMILGDFGDYKPALMQSGVHLLEQPREDSERSKTRTASDRGEFGIMPERAATPAEEAAITWLEVEPRRGKVIRIALGSMGPPMAALRKCIDDLVSGWGIDVAAHASLTRAAAPLNNSGPWLTAEDYPANLWSQGAQGLVNFRLSIDATGTPTQCHIQTSTRPEGFDRAVCQGIMKRARFSPALDRNGQPIASYWRSSVRFTMH